MRDLEPERMVNKLQAVGLAGACREGLVTKTVLLLYNGAGDMHKFEVDHPHFGAAHNTGCIVSQLKVLVTSVVHICLI